MTEVTTKPAVPATLEDLSETPGESMAMVRRDEMIGRTLETDEYTRRRQALLRFVHTQLTPAEMDDAGRLTKINDYYTVPGSSQIALSKKGGELLGELYKYKTFKSEITESQFSAEYGYARADVILHRAGIVVGAASAACTSLEKTFQRSAKKYMVGEPLKVDWRAARNDIEARAQKRAYVRAMIGACAASDIFAVMDEQDEGEGKGGIARLLELVKHSAFTDAQRGQVKVWLKTATSDAIDEQVQRAEEKILVWKEKHGQKGPLE